MGLLRWLGIGKVEPLATQKELSFDFDVKNESDEQHPMFETEEQYIKQGFFSVLEHTDIHPDIQEALYFDYKEAHGSGDPRQQYKAVENWLLDLDFTWTEFDEWKEIFNKNNEWPYTWKRYPEIYTQRPFSTNNIAQEVKYLRVADMKKVAKIHNATSLQKRDELEEFIINNVSVEEVRKIVPDRVEEQIQNFDKKNKIGCCRLLMQTISSTIYSVRNKEKRRQMVMDGIEFCTSTCGCPVEKYYASQYDDGIIERHPPFFPGDRTSLVMKRDRER